MSLKSDILSALERSGGAPVSGQELSERFGVSRSAVWKAVNALRRDGHDISSSTNIGYSLVSESDSISAEGIRAALPESRRGIDIEVLSETGSTNNEAKRLIAEGRDGYLLVAADRQTAGKGRLGRAFFSPSGSLYMSLAFRVDTEIADAVRLTTAAAVAVVRAIEELTPLRPADKVGQRRISRREKDLRHTHRGRHGHGVRPGAPHGDRHRAQLRHREFPPELRDIAASIDRGGVSRSRFAAHIASELIDCIEGAPFLDFYREHSLVIGREIWFIQDGVSTPATAVGIDDSGALIVRLRDGGTKLLNTAR